MRSRRNQLAALVLALTVALLVPVGMRVQAQDQSADPAAVVQAFRDAINGGDAAPAAALFTDNAILVRAAATGTCSRQSPCIGRPAILAQFQALVAGHECHIAIEDTVSGSVVTTHLEARNDALRSRGIERVLLVALTQVEQGKAAAWYIVFDLSDPQTAASVAIGAGTQAPGAPIPNPATPCG